MNVQFERIKKRANLSLPVLADMDRKIVFELQFQTTLLGFQTPPLGLANGILRF